MFRKVLVANRGAIATRILRTLRAMGVGSVAVYAEEDESSLHVEQADEAHCLGSGGAPETYLALDRLFAVAAASGAEAIHPGYGFLSESPELVARCEAEGVAFIGPTAEQIRAFGWKHEARALASRCGLERVPGTDLLEGPGEAVAAAERIGFPVMLKSTAGGGGIGMRRCDSADELRRAFESVARLGEQNFGHRGLFLERLIERARHIEVQVFGDGRGTVIALGERDCSAQRRHQKVVEETPAPGLDEAQRRGLHEAAVRLLASVSYRSAGTVEFVYDVDRARFHFLEVNTRLQVEHGVTEQVYGVDLVRWMIELAAGVLPPLRELAEAARPRGHAMQVRLYAEDPHRGFRPSAGRLACVELPEADGRVLRVEHWITSGTEVSPRFDPMLAKIIGWGEDREAARRVLRDALDRCTIYGVETNQGYLRRLLDEPSLVEGRLHTRTLETLGHRPASVEVLAPGTQTTVQDHPGRTGYWDVGVPPSGPFDDWSFRLGNRLLENEPTAAGLEMVAGGPTLRFAVATQVVLAGAGMAAEVDGLPVPFWEVVDVPADGTLAIGRLRESGARAYLLVRGGFQVPPYLGSRATFTLGGFGGHAGRALRRGDVLHLRACAPVAARRLSPDLVPSYGSRSELAVIYGPHGAPDFFTDGDVETLFATDWEVHYNSSRTGVRLIGPRPEWARADGGEAGLHPSNIHDNAYAIGTVDFTGDMPVILGPDGPSLGGFVCPATVIAAERWRIGQLRAGDRVRFVPVTIDEAARRRDAYETALAALAGPSPAAARSDEAGAAAALAGPARERSRSSRSGVAIVHRPSGDDYLLIEYGPPVLDLGLRFRVHAVAGWLEQRRPPGLLELTPGIRSLQVHYEPRLLPLAALEDLLAEAEAAGDGAVDLEVPSRIVHLPLSWDDVACREAIARYTSSVRADAPWCPSNIEFIRRINGLDDVEDVKRIVFAASYLVLGLGDVYLGAPVATPIDPRHRLVTTKYNPARTWTAENSVGIGGAYLCVYGMEGPGGYQFVGRTLQMWNRYRSTPAFERPWLLRAFDQIRFHPVTAEELLRIRREFPRGRYALRIEETRFRWSEYEDLLTANATEIEAFRRRRERAFAEELERWKASGALLPESDAPPAVEKAVAVPAGCVAVESHVAGSLWRLAVGEGEAVEEGGVVAIVESMKTEIEIVSPVRGRVRELRRRERQPVAAGDCVAIVEPA